MKTSRQLRLRRGVLAAALSLPVPLRAQAPDAASLEALLETGDWNDRIHAVHMLGYLGGAGRAGLESASRDGDWQVRMAAAHALAPLGDPAAPILRRMRAQDPCRVVRLIALHNLGAREPGAQEAAAIAEIYHGRPHEPNGEGCVDQPGPGKLGAAAPSSRGRSAPPSPAAASVAEPDVPRRAEAAVSAPTARPGPELLVPAPSGGRPSGETLPRGAGAGVRESAAVAGRYEGPGGKAPHDPVPDLIASLQSPDSRARARAADELGRMGAAAARAVRPLIAAARDPSPRVRASAGYALGNIGESSDDGLSALEEALKDPSPDVRHSAAGALSRIPSPKARAILGRALGAR